MSWNRWNNRKRRERAEAACAQWNEDDGIDPRSFFRPSRRRDHRKTQQLCGQVARVINCVLGESGDPLLYDLMVEEVIPAPDTSHLQVFVMPMGDNRAVSPAVLLPALARYQSAMKDEIARTIQRKRVPALSFQVMLPPGTTSTEAGQIFDKLDLDRDEDRDANGSLNPSSSQGEAQSTWEREDAHGAK